MLEAHVQKKLRLVIPFYDWRKLSWMFFCLFSLLHAVVASNVTVLCLSTVLLKASVILLFS